MTGGPTPADYDAWNEEKKAIQNSATPPAFFKEREVWWCSLGVNVGNEQNGDTQQHDGRPATFRRPVLVLRKISNRACIVLPLTTQGRAEGCVALIDVAAG